MRVVGVASIVNYTLVCLHICEDLCKGGSGVRPSSRKRESKKEWLDAAQPSYYAR
jgi:hypothetical protein